MTSPALHQLAAIAAGWPMYGRYPSGSLTQSCPCRSADYQVNALPMIRVALHRIVWLGLADVEGQQWIAEVR